MGGRHDPLVLILSGVADEHVALVTRLLDERGIDNITFDPGWFPERATATFEIGGTGPPRATLEFEDTRAELSDVTAVWHRRPNSPRPHATLQEPSLVNYVDLSCQHLLDGLWETLACRWLPATPSIDRAAHNKVKQLELALRLGFALPETLIGNDPDRVATFLSSCPEPPVSKSLIQRPLEIDGGDVPVIYTRPVVRRDARRIAAVRRAPVIFQRYVPKTVEVRATIVGHQVLAAEIDSQAQRSTRHDWRHYHDERVSYREHELPSELRSRLVELVHALGLTYGAVDLVRRPDGAYVFLEINPNGQWGFIEHFTGLPIAEAVADFLSDTEHD